MSIWQKMKSWFSEPTTRYVMHAIPANRIDRPYDPQPLVADKSYVRIWLVEMMLSKSRDWFAGYQPAVHASTRLKFADQKPEITRVAAPSKEKFVGDDAVLKNYALLDLVPFRGGTVEIDAALIAVKGDDGIGKAIAAVAGFADLVAPPLAAALAIATKVKESADLLFDENGQVRLAYHNELGGAGGANSLVPGYIAVVLADAATFDASQLCVRGDQLCWGPNLQAAKPVTGFDHMLIRIESATSRDDLHNFQDVGKLRDQANAAFARGSKEEGENAYRAALATVAVHPELINADRRTVIQAIRDDVALYRDAAHGATPMPDVAPALWADLVSRMKPVKDAAPVTSAELDTWMAT